MYTKLSESASSYTRYYVSPTGGVVLQELTVHQEIMLEPEEAARLRAALAPPANPFFALDDAPAIPAQPWCEQEGCTVHIPEIAGRPCGCHVPGRFNAAKCYSARIGRYTSDDWCNCACHRPCNVPADEAAQRLRRGVEALDAESDIYTDPEMRDELRRLSGTRPCEER